MGQVLHGSATTTEAIRRAIQHSQASLSRHTLLPLDDCLYALQPTLPHLTRSTLHRCFQRHGISRLPDAGGDKPQRSRFKRYPIGFFHIDIAEVRTEQGKLYLLVAIDIVGLYMSPPTHAVVLSIDEKSQIQALSSTRPGTPVRPGRPATMTHDYERHGTTTLFAALNVLDGTVLGRCMQRHRHQEFIRFLNTVEASVPPGKVVHVILDNYAAHEHPRVRAWLSRHPRWIFHFTPTSASWINAVETFFSALTRRRLRRGDFRSLVDLQTAINATSLSTTMIHAPSPGPNRPKPSSTRSTATLNQPNESVH